MAKVLVVDDSGTMRKIIMKVIREAGFSCEFVEAGNGHQGLEELGKAEFDLILTDLNMPEMDGLQFVRCVRDQKELEAHSVGNLNLIKRVGNKVPIVMITTDVGLNKVQQALDSGANDYLKKPFTPEQLREKLAAFLG